MINRVFAAGAVLLCCISCSLFSDLRKRTFSYAEGNQTATLHTLVPKRYAKRETLVDSAGNQQEYYRYGNGAFLYVIHTMDTGTLFQPIDTAQHIPRQHPYGGVMYKGMDSAHLFWREIRTDSFRFGYRNVPPDVESLFDSAVNYAAMRRFKK